MGIQKGQTDMGLSFLAQTQIILPPKHSCGNKVQSGVILPSYGFSPCDPADAHQDLQCWGKYFASKNAQPLRKQSVSSSTCSPSKRFLSVLRLSPVFFGVSGFSAAPIPRTCTYGYREIWAITCCGGLCRSVCTNVCQSK